jgi:hypothetical protein
MQRAILGQLGHPIQEAKIGETRFSQFLSATTVGVGLRRKRCFPVSQNFADTSPVCFRFLRKYTLLPRLLYTFLWQF